MIKEYIQMIIEQNIRNMFICHRALSGKKNDIDWGDIYEKRCSGNIQYFNDNYTQKWDLNENNN